jgi:mRNA interferase YafQ
MAYEIERTGRFKHDYKLIKKRGYDISLLRDVIYTLAEGGSLPEKHKDHALTGDWAGHRECHVQPDWLLIYRIFNDRLILVLSRTGTHSDLFGG